MENNNKEPKYQTVDECLKQIEWCAYECEAGKVQMNIAYQQLVSWARKWEAIKHKYVNLTWDELS